MMESNKTKITVINEESGIRMETEIELKQEIKPGMIVRIFEQPDGSLRLKIGWPAERLTGMLKNNGIHLTIEQISEAIAEGAVRSALGIHDDDDDDENDPASPGGARSRHQAQRRQSK